ncbi:MAG: hypothetical protein M1337_06005 [Actinobacteria bacterium]|nr:hypothetical protein [Actinomycetota bacterium]
MVRPAGQEYLGDSGVLVTRVTCGDLLLECRDVMPWGGDALIREGVTQRLGDMLLPHHIRQYLGSPLSIEDLG